VYPTRRILTKYKPRFILITINLKGEFYAQIKFKPQIMHVPSLHLLLHF